LCGKLKMWEPEEGKKMIITIFDLGLLVELKGGAQPGGVRRKGEKVCGIILETYKPAARTKIFGLWGRRET